MKLRTYVIASLSALSLAACGKSEVAGCKGNADCPANARCAAGVCETVAPSGGTASTLSGSSRMTAGTLTVDVVVGQPAAWKPASGAGVTVSDPALTR